MDRWMCPPSLVCIDDDARFQRFEGGTSSGGRCSLSLCFHLCIDKPIRSFATKYMWWFLLIQPEPLPEHLVGLDPEFYLEEVLRGLNKTPGAITPEARSEYRRCFCCTSTIHATCEDMRAAAELDLGMDEADACGQQDRCAASRSLGGRKEP
jgi:hypothetical protein